MLFHFKDKFPQLNSYWNKYLPFQKRIEVPAKSILLEETLNLPLLGEVFPKVFRIGGPNFHSIAFAYALSVMSIWLLFNKRWLLPLAALPLLLVIGSKGAMIMLLMAMFVRVAIIIVGLVLANSARDAETFTEGRMLGLIG